MWNPLRFSLAALGLYQAQLALLSSLVRVSVDAGVNAMQTQLTTGTLVGGKAAGTAARGQAIWYRVLPN